MKPVRFDYQRPTSIAQALTLMQQQDLVVKAVAGNQSLGPMLNLRLVQPDLLVDITGIPELKRVETQSDCMILGACITHADIEDGRIPDNTGGALLAVARGIAYRAVRCRGTIGGSLAHADPAADWVTCLSTMGADVIIAGPAGTRTMAIADFVTGVFEAALEAGEILEAVKIPKFSAGAHWGYYKVCRKTGELAHAMGAFLHDPERELMRAAIGATASRPIVLTDARSLFTGKPEGHLPGHFDAGAVEHALTKSGMIDPLDNRIHITALKRAIEQARLA